jgi:hypothetical protein
VTLATRLTGFFIFLVFVCLLFGLLAVFFGETPHPSAQSLL